MAAAAKQAIEVAKAATKAAVVVATVTATATVQGARSRPQSKRAA